MKKILLGMAVFLVLQVLLKIGPVNASANQKGETSHPTAKKTYTFE